MSNKTAVLLLCSLIVLSGCHEEPNINVSKEAQAKLAEAYAIAVSYPDKLPTFAVENAQFFSENGPSIVVGRTLVLELREATLRKAALQGPSPDEIREQAYLVAKRAGQPQDFAEDLASDSISNRAGQLQLASYIEQLVETLPSAASGNPQPYRDTLLYTTASFIWSSAVQIMQDEDSKPLRDMSVEMNKWTVTFFIEQTQ